MAAAVAVGRCGGEGVETFATLDEARETEDPGRLARAFGISSTTAMKYIHAAHPHRAGPVPQ